MIVGGYWTLPCGECDGTGRWSISTLRTLHLLRARWWRWPREAAYALRRRECVPCRGTGYAIACLARPR
jgi:hypothetical protein